MLMHSCHRVHCNDTFMSNEINCQIKKMHRFDILQDLMTFVLMTKTHCLAAVRPLCKYANAYNYFEIIHQDV